MAAVARVPRAGSVRHYTTFLAGYGISACGGFITTVTLARHFPPAEFGPIGLLFTLAVAVAFVGSGFDTACTRVIASLGPTTEVAPLLRLNARRRAVWYSIALVVVATGWHPELRLVLPLVLLALGQVILAQRLIVPTARGESARFVRAQGAWSVTLIAPAATSMAVGGGPHAFLLLLVGALLVYCFGEGASWWRDLGGSIASEGASSENLVLLSTVGTAMFIGGLLFVVYERVDAVLISAFYDNGSLGRYLAAVRVVSTLTLITAGSQAALTNRLEALRQRQPQRFFAAARVAAMAMSAAALPFVAVLAVIVVPLLGSAYRGAPALVVILSTSYVLMAAAVGYLVALPVVVSPRLIVIQGGLPLIVKTIWIALIGRHNLLLAAAGSGIGAATSVTIAGLFVRRALRSPVAQANATRECTAIERGIRFARTCRRSAWRSLQHSICGFASVSGASMCGLLVAVNARAALAAVGVLVVGLASFMNQGFVLGTVLALRNLTDMDAQLSLIHGLHRANPSSLIGLAVICLASLRLARLGGARIGAELVVASVALVAWYAVGVHNYGFDPAFLRELLRSLSVIAIVVLVRRWDTPRIAKRVTDLVLLGNVIPACVAVSQLVAHAGGVGTGSWRSSGTFAHANTAAVAFSLCSALALWQASSSDRRSRYKLALLLYLSALLTTASLGGIAQTLAEGFVFMSLSGRAPQLRRRVLVATGLVAAAFVASPVGSARLGALASTRSPQEAAHGAVSNSLDWRFLNWSQLIDAWHRRPVLGAGLGTTSSVVTPENNIAHSDYVRLLVETGIVGFIVFGGLMLMLVRAVYRKHIFSSIRDGYEALVVAVLIGILVHGLVASVSLETAPVYCLAAVIAAAFRGKSAEYGGWALS